MAARLPSGLYLSDEDAAVLDHIVLLGLVELRRRNGGIPAGVEQRAKVIHQAAEEFRASVQVDAGSGTSDDGNGSAPRMSIVTDRLSVQQAARAAGVSESFVTRILRRGVVTATRSGSRGEWVIDSGQWAAWMAERSQRQAA